MQANNACTPYLLFLMGTDAREYILEQREKASPELKAEIDKVWQEILDRDRQ